MVKTEKPEQAKRAHKATYARDKRKGGYLVRVMGPYADRFAGREVPVTRKDNSESPEKLTHIVWSGKDAETGMPVSLYHFEPKPKDEDREMNF